MTDADPKKIVDAMDRPIWGCAAISKVLNRSESKTNYLLKNRLVDASKAGKNWWSTPRRLLTPQRERR